MQSKLLILAALVVALFFGYRYWSAGPKISVEELQGDTIICFGDSLTYGTGAPSGKGYPEQLGRLIDRPVINAGIPGDTTTGALARLQKDVLDRSPRLVLITIGGNDLKNGVALETARANLQAILSSIRSHGALAVVGGINIPLMDRGFGRMYEEVTEETDALLVDNILGGIMGHANLMSDQIHPNGAGYAIMAERFKEAIEPYL